MEKKTNKVRECEECGALIESSSPGSRLCKRCATQLQDKRSKDGGKFRPKEPKKKKKGSRDEDYYDDYR